MNATPLAIELRPVTSLKSYANNARRHSRRQIRQIAESIRRFGFTNLVLIRDDGGIIAGHGRVMAAKELGLETVPTLKLSHLTPEEVRAYVIADNKLALNADWDNEMLAIEFQALIDSEFDLSFTGFSLAEIDFTFDQAREASIETPDELNVIPDLPEAAVTRLGDLWILGKHRLLCGDAREKRDYSPLLRAEKADLIFMDPPYNVEIDGNVTGLGRHSHREFAMASGEMSREAFTEFLTITLSNAASVSKDGAIAFACMDWRHIREMTEAGEAAFTEFKNLCVWNKTNGGMGSFYRSKHELIFVFKVGTALHTNNFGLGETGRYLRLGSIGELAAALDREGVRPRPRKLASGTIIAAERFMVGPLAHVLKNRCYVGEIAYRGEIHKSEHEPILERDLFDAGQARLAEGVVKRKLMRSRYSSMLVGHLFDDRGNPMSPSHANKKGVRYRYYVSHALLQNRKSDAGTVSRMSAPDIEQLVCGAVRKALNANDSACDRDLIRARIDRIVILSDRIAVTFREPELEADLSDSERAPNRSTELTIPFVPKLSSRKGVAHAPMDQETIGSETRDTLLKAIARSRGWMETILSDKTASFDNIAAAEGLAERHVRRLAVLAFLSPKVIQAIADGAAPSGVTVSSLTQALPHAWADQERLLSLG